MSAEISPEPVLEEPLSRSARLLFWAGQLPWWAIFIVAIVVGFGIYTFTTPSQRDILIWLLNDPQLTTDELNRVVYERETEAYLIDETYLLGDLRGNRVTVSKRYVTSEAEGTLECPAGAENCLSQRGVIVTYQDLRVPENVTPDGFLELEGVATETGSGIVNLRNVATKVTLADGNNRLVQQENILEEGEGNDFVLTCDRLLNPNCQNIVGQYIKFQVPYIEARGILTRVDIVIRHPEEQFIRTIRPTRVLERRAATIACPENTSSDCEPFPATLVIYPERISGVETKIEGSKRTVRVVSQETVMIGRECIIDLGVGTVTCRRDKDPACQDFEGTIVLAEGETFRWRLTSETNTNYKIILEGDTEFTEFNRLDILEETRSPEDCRPQDEAECGITIKLKDFSIGGRIVEDTDTALVLETVPEKLVVIDEDQIYNVRQRIPEGCGLNNLRGCDQGIWLTIIVTLTAYSSALLVGLFMGLLRVSSNPILYHFSSFYVEMIRGIPLLVLLMYFAFVISPTIRDSEFILLAPFRAFYDLATEIEIAVLGQESFLAEATIGLAIGYSAFMAEVFRAGIESIHKGQMEAARSLGMSYFESMRHVILPQAIRVVLPPLGNEFIAILKDSALISVLALPDLLQMGRIYASRVFQARPAYTMVAWVYIVMTLLLSLAVRYVERRSRLP
jgi:polar amino acid transport system permease protein